MGCGPAAPVEFPANEVEWLKQAKINLGADESFGTPIREEVNAIMDQLFGSPDDLRFPFIDVADAAVELPGPIVDLDKLTLAAGAVASDDEGLPQGLYREHCANCHGIAGDGAGPNASILDPYPRDFRHGKFKFKSTSASQPPSDEDLRRILQHGIPGTAMPSFHLLEDDELDAIIDYVKYLAIRGQFERYLLNEVPFLNGDSFFENSAQRDQLLTSYLSESKTEQTDNPSEDEYEKALNRINRPTASVSNQQLVAYLFKEYPDTFEQFQTFVLNRWAEANQLESGIAQVPAQPAWLSSDHPEHTDKVAQGEALFLGKATCYQCHGKDGKGGGELVGYDDWTNDWLKAPGVDMEDPKVIKAFVKAGAMRPRFARPRNLHQQIYRGGDQPSDVYLRIAFGIEGTPMPAGAALQSEEIWSLVAYVKSLRREGGAK